MVEPQSRTPSRLRRLLRFRLRTFFIAMTVLCVLIAVTTNRANRQRRAVETMVANGGEFNYDYQRQTRPTSSPFSAGPFVPPSGDSFSMRATPPGNPWLRRLVGDHYFITPVSLRFSNQRVVEDDGLAALADLPELTTLGVSGVELRELDFAHFRHLTKLRLLTLRNTLPTNATARDFGFLRYCTQLETISTRDADFGDAALKHLDSPNIRALFLYETDVGDSGLEHLKRFNSLKLLGISRTKITDAGLAHLAALPNLQYLSANNTALTDAGVGSLKQMKSLQELEVCNTGISKKGVAEIQSALPNCRVVR